VEQDRGLAGQGGSVAAHYLLAYSDIFDQHCVFTTTKQRDVYTPGLYRLVFLGKRVPPLAMDWPPVTKTSRMSIHKEYTCYCPFRPKSPTSCNGLSAGDEDVHDTRTTRTNVHLGKSVQPLTMDCPLVTKTSMTPGLHGLLYLLGKESQQWTVHC
jgi:hypothetical protein